MLEVLRQEIETLSPEDQERLLAIIYILKQNLEPTAPNPTPKQSLYEKFEQQGLIGCFDDDDNVSSNYKALLTESLEKKYGYR